MDFQSNLYANSRSDMDGTHILYISGQMSSFEFVYAIICCLLFFPSKKNALRTSVLEHIF